MQDVRIGLQRIPPTSLLVSAATTAKENVGSVAWKAWSSQQTSAAGQSSEDPAAQAASELMEVTPPASQLGEEEEGEGGGRETSGAGGPLPQLSWANPRELWAEMRGKDVCQTVPEEELQSRHPGILPTMRTILFDWLMEVGVVTYHRVCEWRPVRFVTTGGGRKGGCVSLGKGVCTLKRCIHLMLYTCCLPLVPNSPNKQSDPLCNVQHTHTHTSGKCVSRSALYTFMVR